MVWARIALVVMLCGASTLAVAQAPKPAPVLEPLDQTATAVARGYTYASTSDQTPGLELLPRGSTVHVDGHVPGTRWYHVSGGVLTRGGYAKAETLGLPGPAGAARAKPAIAASLSVPVPGSSEKPGSPRVPGPAAVSAPDNGTRAFRAKNYRAAMRLFKDAAAHGDVGAQYYIGYLYQRGFGVAVDDALAMQWYLAAADQGMAQAQAQIAYLYLHGLGVAIDYGEAMKWYTLAADHELAVAQSQIGFLYQNGFGVPQDYALAMQWYRKAADQKYAPALTQIGLLYANGLGVDKDPAQARRWFGLAAKQGKAPAQIRASYGK